MSPTRPDQLNEYGNGGTSKAHLDDGALQGVDAPREMRTERQSGTCGEDDPGHEKASRFGEKREERMQYEPGETACHRTECQTSQQDAVLYRVKAGWNGSTFWVLRF